VICYQEQSVELDEMIMGAMDQLFVGVLPCATSNGQPSADVDQCCISLLDAVIFFTPFVSMRTCTKRYADDM
jgi:hypothetical protein